MKDDILQDFLENHRVGVHLDHAEGLPGPEVDDGPGHGDDLGVRVGNVIILAVGGYEQGPAL